MCRPGRGGAGVGGVAGDERAEALEDDPLAEERWVDEVIEEGPAVSGGDGGGQPADVAHLRRDAKVEELHHPEGVVHHDGNVEGQAAAAVALGQHVREACSEEVDQVTL